MNDHTTAVVRSIHYHLRRLAKIRSHLDMATTASAINALITSRLDLNNGLFAGASLYNIRRLQLAQNNAARLLTHTRKSEHISPVLEQLHWLPVSQRIVFKVLSIVYTVLHDRCAPVYLCDMFQEYVPRRSLGSQSSYKQLVTHRVKSSYGDRAFCTAGLDSGIIYLRSFAVNLHSRHSRKNWKLICLNLIYNWNCSD